MGGNQLNYYSIFVVTWTFFITKTFNVGNFHPLLTRQFYFFLNFLSALEIQFHTIVLLLTNYCDSKCSFNTSVLRFYVILKQWFCDIVCDC